ncbi:MAG: DedA family protein [Chloroflexaceae bacterium]|nr:DedA family protein [Chloroflexaceae bacterium]
MTTPTSPPTSTTSTTPTSPPTSTTSTTPQPPQTPQPLPPPALTWRSILLLVGTVLLTLALMMVPVEAVERLGKHYSYLGVFVLTMLASATILLPSPALGAALLAGKTLNPWLVGVLAGTAAALGEITGYVAGYSGSPLVARSKWYPRVERWVQRWGGMTVFLLAAAPLPLIDLAGIAAGTMRMPFPVYLGACLIGKTLRFLMVAWIGWAIGQIFP